MKTKAKRKKSLLFKLMMGLLVIIVVIAVSVGGWLASVSGGLNKAHEPREAVVGSGLQRALVIYQPSGNDTTGEVAEALAEQLAAGGFTVTLNYPSGDLAYDWQDYDVIAFGTPVHLGKVSSALEEYATGLAIRDKNLMLFATGMNLEVTAELSAMGEWFDGSNRVDAIKVGSADPAMMEWFVDGCFARWSTAGASGGPLQIHETSGSGIDAVTGATMKGE